MYDTVEIISSPLGYDLASLIKDKVKILQSYYANELEWQITTSELIGSYDSKLSIRIIDGDRIKISGSVHKFIMGHNIYGGPSNIAECFEYLVLIVQKYLEIDLPIWQIWEVSRVDITHTFDLSTFFNVTEYIKQLRGCIYPRRKANNYGTTSQYFAGSTTTLKFYHKGPEFRVHDKKRLKRLVGRSPEWSYDKINELEDIADKMLRVEVGIRRRKFKEDKVSYVCGDVTDYYLNNVYHSEVTKVLREGLSDMEIVRDIQSVQIRLEKFYPKRKARNLMNIWTRIQMQGADTVSNSVSRMTWYNYRRDLTNAGISLQGDGQWVEKSLIDGPTILRDFVPLPGRKYCLESDLCNLKEEIARLEQIA